MEMTQAIWLLLVLAVVLANIPFILANRMFVFIKVPEKNFATILSEWFLYFLVTGMFAFLLENKSMGEVATQDWEFYTVVLFLFMIFAFPGFIYRYNLKQFIKKSNA